MLMDIYKDMLRAAVKPPCANYAPTYAKVNTELEVVLKLIRHQCAGEFQDTVSAKQRVFFDEPLSLPAKSYDHYIVRAPR